MANENCHTQRYTHAFTSAMKVQCTRPKPHSSFSCVCCESMWPVNYTSWFLSCSSIKKLFTFEDCLLPWKDIPTIQGLWWIPVLLLTSLPPAPEPPLPRLLRTLLFLPLFLCTWSSVFSYVEPQCSFPTLRKGPGLTYSSTSTPSLLDRPEWGCPSVLSYHWVLFILFTRIKL